MKIQCDRCGKVVSDLDIYVLNNGFIYGHICRSLLCKGCYKIEFNHKEHQESKGERIINDILHPQRLMR